jgi:hypothetical protein
MASTCITSVDLCAIRVAKLNDAGHPLAGATNGYLSVAPIDLTVKLTTEKGDDLTLENGCGTIMATLQTPDKIKGASLDLNLCQLDAELIGIMTGAPLFTSGSDAVGFQFASVGTSPSPICFEGWSKAWTSSGSQLSHTFTSPNATYIHWVFPFTRWTQGDLKMEHQLMQVPVSGVAYENANITVNGPYDDWPATIAAQGGVQHLAGWFYDSAPPSATCTYTSVTSAAS